MARRSNQKILSHDARKLFHYDPEAGALYWSKSRGSAKSGSRVGYVHADGERRVVVDGATMSEAAVIYLIEHGRWPTKGLYHVNRDKSDNRIGNLANGSGEVGAMRFELWGNPRELVVELEVQPPPLPAALLWLVCP